MSREVLTRTPPPADHRVHYGPGEFAFGDLRLPSPASDTRAGGKLVPVVVFLHGGWWKAEYGLEYGGHLCNDLKQHGVATWSLEYRRVGNPGGGWPGTFEDVAAGYDFLATLARTYPLDLSRVVVAGHSAGGHLAFWLAGRPHLPEASKAGDWARLRQQLPMRAVVALAGAVDLRMTIDLSGWLRFAHDKQEVLDLMGATPEDAPGRYRVGDPGALLPLNVPQFLVQGSEDQEIPPKLPERWVDRGRKLGEQVKALTLDGADHYDIVDPQSAVWPRIRALILQAL